MSIFHLAYNVTDLDTTRRFYGDLLGCVEGRSTDTWVDFSTIRAQLPRRISNPVGYLNSYHNIEHSDSLFRYLVHISDHLTEGEVAPVEMVTADITNIILNKRKIEFIKDLEHRVYTDGVSRNQFEIY